MEDLTKSSAFGPRYLAIFQVLMSSNVKDVPLSSLYHSRIRFAKSQMTSSISRTIRMLFFFLRRDAYSDPSHAYRNSGRFSIHTESFDATLQTKSQASL